MGYRKEINFNNNNPFSSITGILLVVLFLVVLYFIARAIFTILYYLSPVMIVAALIVDYRVVLGYFKWLGGLLRDNLLLGIGAILLSVLGFPVLSAFLLGKALFKRQVKKARAQEEVRAPGDGEYIEFEELEDEPLELPRIPKQEKPREQPKKKDSHYDEFFE
ncbi:MAG: hypothetical protein KDD19_03070 [Phaeodactylibacter sp.]|nr:hypothetical protein [Phaeodactylibacter sp.]MCB9050968.1 hypothetical protein [Lewinellaceae bacterium]